MTSMPHFWHCIIQHGNPKDLVFSLVIARYVPVFVSDRAIQFVGRHHFTSHEHLPFELGRGFEPPGPVPVPGAVAARWDGDCPEWALHKVLQQLPLFIRALGPGVEFVDLQQLPELGDPHSGRGGHRAREPDIQ